MSGAGDVLIIGGGLAGLFCALKLAPRPVTLLAPAPLGQGASSAWAQGGVAAAIAEGDTPEKHTQDTIAAGAGLVDEAVVLGMAREARARIEDLLSFGVPFDKDLEGRLVQSREAAHSERRIVRVKGDQAGGAIMQALVAAVRATPSIDVREGYEAERLLVENGRVVGAVARVHGGARLAIPAGATILATGGLGHLYAVTTNPPQSAGAGLAMAAQAGAAIRDAEFVQFHPTAIDIGRDPAPLATEALRGDGAILIDRDGRRFMPAIHRDAELAPRDVVARGVFAQIAAGRGAFLDCRQAIGAEFPERFPTVYASCVAAGIDPVAMPIPVAPAEHYHMGGVFTDARGRTSLEGLYAAGEVASTGVHGANRLASNSLLEAVVFAARIAEDLRDADLPRPPAPPTPTADTRDGAAAGDAPLIARLRQTMSRHVGVVRDGEGLREALRVILEIEGALRSASARNMCASALLVATPAFLRRESRGGHCRSDFPEPDPAADHSRLTLAEARRLARDILETSA